MKKDNLPKLAKSDKFYKTDVRPSFTRLSEMQTKTRINERNRIIAIIKDTWPRTDLRDNVIYRIRSEQEEGNMLNKIKRFDI